MSSSASLPRDTQVLISKGGHKFIVDTKYELEKSIGHGAYGQVIAAYDKVAKKKVAIKKITDAFDDLIDGKRILREICLLKHLDHENVIKIINIVKPPKVRDYNDVYIVTDLMEADLQRIISSRQKLSEEHVQYFVYQILRALKYLHSANIIHRDLKPANILCNENCDLKICDFGLARIEETADDMTEYVVTRWYRAPELLMSVTDYGRAIDVWSVGCIFAELCLRIPLFPGNDIRHQLSLIIDKIGSPTEAELYFVKNPKVKQYMLRQKKRRAKPFTQILPKSSDKVRGVVKSMLEFEPAKRMTVDNALDHPFFSSLRKDDEIPIAKSLFEFRFEAEKMTREFLEVSIFKEACEYHPEIKPELQQYMVDPTNAKRLRMMGIDSVSVSPLPSPASTGPVVLGAGSSALNKEAKPPTSELQAFIVKLQEGKVMCFHFTRELERRTARLLLDDDGFILSLQGKKGSGLSLKRVKTVEDGDNIPPGQGPKRAAERCFSLVFEDIRVNLEASSKEEKLYLINNFRKLVESLKKG